MDPRQPHPESFGVFKPVGHVVIAFADGHACSQAADRLGASGLAADAVVRYDPERMKAQVEADLAHASPLASLGQEMNLVKAHRDFAERGYHFLVVRARDDEEAQRVAMIARDLGAQRAQYYGRFTIEELIEPGGSGPQVFESPSRGLDTGTDRTER